MGLLQPCTAVTRDRLDLWCPVHVLRSDPLPWQVFWNVTLPNIRWGLMYGIILTNAVSRRC